MQIKKIFTIFIVCVFGGFNLLSSDQHARFLQELEQELDLKNPLDFIESLQPLTVIHDFKSIEDSYKNFITAFSEHFSGTATPTSELKNYVNNDNLFTEHFSAWKENFHQNQVALAGLQALATRNNIPYSINTPFVVRYLLKEIAFNSFWEDWGEFNAIFSLGGEDEILKEKIKLFQNNFYEAYPTVPLRIDFAFNLLYFFTYIQTTQFTTIKNTISKQSFFKHLKVVEGMNQSVADQIDNIKHAPSIVFANSKKDFFNFAPSSKRGKELANELYSIKIVSSSKVYHSGIFGFAEWPDEYVNKFFLALEKAGSKNANPNNIWVSVSDDFPLPLAELRLVVNQEYLGPKTDRDKVFERLLGYFKTTNQFNDYLKMADKWFPQMPMIKGPLKTTFSYELFRKFNTKERETINNFQLAVLFDETIHREHHLTVLTDVIEELKKTEQDSQVLRTALGGKKTLTREEVEALTVVEELLADIKNVVHSRKQPKKAAKRGKKNNKKGASKKSVKYKQPIPTPAYNTFYNSSKRPQKRPVPVLMSKEEVEKFYPDLTIKGQEYYTSSPVMLTSDVDSYKEAIAAILLFRKSHLEIVDEKNLDVDTSTNGDTDTSIITQRLSLMQEKFRYLPPTAPGYLPALEQLLKAQKFVNEQIQYHHIIAHILGIMRMDNYIASRKYFFALNGYARLYADAQKILSVHPDKRKNEALTSSKNKIMPSLKHYSETTGIEATFWQEFHDANTQRAALSSALSVSAEMVYPDLVNSMSKEYPFNQYASVKAQEEITADTYIVEQKIAIIQNEIRQIMNIFPELLLQ